MRINAQLIDATTGGHLWAERYDGTKDEVFDLQDKITVHIVAALAISLYSSNLIQCTAQCAYTCIFMISWYADTSLLRTSTMA